ncbi:hypothetical protein [Streptomyces californicus]|uniref:hypothetical protein n=1 Tax=Streptomyces californicus TaxID=67351 RepID=UPI00369851DF
MSRPGRESRIFGGAYDGASTEKRPVYGALDFRRERAGTAPRQRRNPDGRGPDRMTAAEATR